MKPISKPVLIETLSHHRDPGFSGMMKLFGRVFPAKEKIDRSYFEDILAEKRLGLLDPFNTHVLIARRDGSPVLGFATGTYLAVVNMGFVGYLAVDPRSKGLRIGGRLRQRLIKEMRKDARAAGHPDLEGVLGEIERINPWLRHLVRERDVLALDVDYRQPPLRKGSPEVPLVLYIETIGAPIHRLSATTVRAVLYAIYRRLYRLRFPLREPSFRTMLRSLGKRRQVGPLRLAPLSTAKAESRPPSRRSSGSPGTEKPKRRSPRNR